MLQKYKSIPFWEKILIKLQLWQNPKPPIYKKRAPQPLAVAILTSVHEIVFHARQTCKQQTNTLLKQNFSENSNMYKFACCCSIFELILLFVDIVFKARQTGKQQTNTLYWNNPYLQE